jgi:hypothetical protein
MKMILLVFVFLSITACSTTSTPKLDPAKIRPWSDELGSEYPRNKAVIAHFKRNNFELFYLAARHTNTMGEDTLNLVQTLFDKFKFNVLIIESLPHSVGESPKWFIDEAKAGRTTKFIKGGESAMSVILASNKKIPFFAGEPDHQDIFRGLKAKGYSDLDVLGFYTVRQIPQWVREQNDKKTMFQKKIPPYLSHYCKTFSVQSCPNAEDVMKWYKDKIGYELTPDVSNEEVAPYAEGKLFTQKISSEIGTIRDHFTLNIIEQMLIKYERVAVVYGASHFSTLRKSFEKYFGLSTFVEDDRDWAMGQF